MKNKITKYDLVDFFAEVEKKKINADGNKIIFSDRELSSLFDSQSISTLEESINQLSFDYGISAEWQYDFDELSDNQTRWLVISVEDRSAYAKLVNELLPQTKEISSFIYRFENGLVIDAINNTLSFEDKSFDLRFSSDSGIFLQALLEASPNPVSVSDLYVLMGESIDDTNKSYKIGEARKYLRQRMISELEITPDFFDQFIHRVAGDGYKIDLPFKKTK